MHLAEIVAENFRLFGSRAESNHLEVRLSPGLSVLVGENDSGKSAVVDAIRAVLGTTAGDSMRVRIEDFYVPEAGKRCSELSIRCKLTFTDIAEAAPFAEYLTIEDSKPVLYLLLHAKRPEEGTETVGLRRGIAVDVHSGAHGEGPRLDALARGLLTTTFLKPLRDAISELAAGRRSRLTQILSNVEGYQHEIKSDFDPSEIVDDKVSIPKTLSGILGLSQFAITKNELVRQAQKNLNDDLLSALSLATAPLSGTIGITESGDVRQILEKLELFLGSDVERLSRGLGSNNVLFMAAELLLLRSSGEFGLPLLIIEEPEAHLHPQWQLTVADYLRRACEEKEFPLQVILTTHSPTLASHLPLSTMILLQRGKTFRLGPGQTKLETSDYRFLERFLDSTRANLFFARGVLIVEGDAENILLPTIAEILGVPLAKFGVSIVNVGHRGLFRYARIFQRAAAPELQGIRVACVADLDPKEGETPQALAAKRDRIIRKVRGGVVECFVAEHDTFEYDLAYAGLAKEIFVSGRLAAQAADADLANVVESEAAAEAEFDAHFGASAPHEQAKAAYDAIKKGRSKAIAAQYCADRLMRDYRHGAFNEVPLVGKLAPYIGDALAYITSPD